MTDDTPTPPPPTPGAPEPAPPHATLVAVDGRLLTLDVGDRGTLRIKLGAAQPSVLDRFQSRALAAAILALEEF